MSAALQKRLVSRMVPDQHGCWLWQGRPSLSGGYGRVRIAGVLYYAHRVAYEAFIGPIPDGLTIDHLCRVTLCINPAHLEPVTFSENTRRENYARAAARRASLQVAA